MKDGVREWALTLEQRHGENHPYAKFQGQDEAVMITTIRAEELQQHETQTNSRKTLWQGTTPDNNKVWISKAKDRNPLLILYMHNGKKKQVYQIRIDLFGPLDDTTTTSKAVEC